VLSFIGKKHMYIIRFFEIFALVLQIAQSVDNSVQNHATPNMDAHDDGQDLLSGSQTLVAIWTKVQTGFREFPRACKPKTFKRRRRNQN
jgi:hypothetical protein